MKAKPKAIRGMVLQAKAAGKSFEAVAAEFEVPLGTVKTWWARHRHETPAIRGKAAVDETGAVGVAVPGDRGRVGERGREGEDAGETHRGLRACHMPGRRASKQLTFSMFKRGMWPPAVWKVPPGIVGGELLMMLQERSCMGLEGKGRKGK